jgi:hypothetical protein
VTVAVVDSAKIKVIPSSKFFLRSSYTSACVKKYLKEAMTPYMYNTPEGYYPRT